MPSLTMLLPRAIYLLSATLVFALSQDAQALLTEYYQTTMLSSADGAIITMVYFLMVARHTRRGAQRYADERCHGEAMFER